jgi:hypothetical protein
VIDREIFETGITQANHTGESVSKRRLAFPVAVIVAVCLSSRAYAQDPANPVAFGLTCSMPAGQTTCTAQAAVPAGKQLVIDHVSARMTAPSGQVAQVYVSISSPNLPGGTIAARHYIAFTPMSSTFYYANQPLLMYGSTAAPVSIQAQRTVYSAGAPGSVNFEIYFTGHLTP